MEKEQRLNNAAKPVVIISSQLVNLINEKLKLPCADKGES